METNALVWFRKGLRIHDNPALDQARRGATKILYPVFVLDPRYLERDPTAFSPGSARAGVSRIQFLMESLSDLDKSLRSLGSRLVVLRGGDPADVIVRVLKEVGEIVRLKLEPQLFRSFWFRLNMFVRSRSGKSASCVTNPILSLTDRLGMLESR